MAHDRPSGFGENNLDPTQPLLITEDEGSLTPALLAAELQEAHSVFEQSVQRVPPDTRSRIHEAMQATLREQNAFLSRHGTFWGRISAAILTLTFNNSRMRALLSPPSTTVFVRIDSSVEGLQAFTLDADAVLSTSPQTRFAPIDARVPEVDEPVGVETPEPSPPDSPKMGR